MNEEQTEHIKAFTEQIGVVFHDPTLIRTAFTHRSYVNEHRGAPIEHNERLEFLGDAVLELVVTRYLFEKFFIVRKAAIGEGGSSGNALFNNKKHQSTIHILVVDHYSIDPVCILYCVYCVRCPFNRDGLE